MAKINWIGLFFIGIIVLGFSWYLYIRTKTPSYLFFVGVGIIFIMFSIIRFIFSSPSKEKTKKEIKTQANTKTQPKIITCNLCGTKNYDYSNYCHMCGARLK